MSVLFPDRMLTLNRRVIGTDAHGDRVAAGFAAATAAYPGRASENPDTPLGTPGGRTWVLDLDPALWPVGQQDMIADVNSGEQWQVTSAQYIPHTLMPLLTHIRITAHSYSDGTKA